MVPRPLFWLLAAVAALACTVDKNAPGPGGGGGGGGSSGGSDGGALLDGGRAGIGGKLCSAPDLRDPLACPDTGADLSGIDVADRDAATATTSDAGGDFWLPQSSGSRTVLAVAATSEPHQAVLVPIALSEGSAADVRIPAIAVEDWQQLRALLGAINPEGSAAVAVYVVDGDQPVTGATVQAPPGTPSVPFTDGDNPLNWIEGGVTGAYGAALIFGVPATGNVTVTVVDNQGSRTASVTDTPTEPGMLTVLFVDVSS